MKDGNVDLLICILHYAKEILASLLCSSPLASPTLTICNLTLKFQLPEKPVWFFVGNEVYKELLKTNPLIEFAAVTIK